MAIGEDELVERIKSLPAWKTQGDFSEAEWNRYLDVARMLQQTPPDMVDRVLEKAAGGADPQASEEAQTKLFLLLRIVFDLPARGPADERRSFKGWTNWPQSDAAGFVDLSWPISWLHGRPTLSGTYQGSMGLPYDARGDFRYLRSKYPYRRL